MLNAAHTRSVKIPFGQQTTNTTSGTNSSFGNVRVTISTDDPKLTAALSALGIDKAATIEQARRAFRKMMSIHHPDHGGDPEMAKKIIAARNELKSRGRI